ncbi:uncharacterized protein MYCFIDRAFT_35403 [Pseudocercospora fijiensis CIRAD86]|uniref:Uncharacterized protein n=1 Tax=Pseudocercospora fijiensis (strain CIRAD86) TaxID=383855 RepID=M2YSS1_PSEFD|nr:uncharacterized protein MYCFIDRAFT_35403 [Pseudocercospora fijiensis CIRAD86]EME80740.1 hypothetical protein MYCFIDRAFT_35403 [Pseudocercospora fijiensis CIRAD86]
MDFLTKRNSAVSDNPPIANNREAQIHITSAGSSFYYAVTAFMGSVGLVILLASHSRPRTDRLFFYLLAGANFVASISYYAMGSDLGFTPIGVQPSPSLYRPNDPKVRGDNRQIFWTRYVDWFVTTPLLLLTMLLTAGVPAPTLLFILFMNEVMIVCGLVGAVTETVYKWGFFAFGCAAFLYVFGGLFGRGRKYAKHLGHDVHRVYLMIAIYQFIIWICYPIGWGVSEGGNLIAPDSEAVYYGVCDMLAKPFYSMIFMFLHRKIDPGRLGLKFRDYDEDFAYNHRHHDSTSGPIREPKEEVPTAAAAAATEAPRASHADESHHHTTTNAAAAETTTV